MTQSINESPDTPLEPPESDSLSLLTRLLLLVLLIAMLASLIWPLLQRQTAIRHRPPTPTPLFLQEA